MIKLQLEKMNYINKLLLQPPLEKNAKNFERLTSWRLYKHLKITEKFNS